MSFCDFLRPPITARLIVSPPTQSGSVIILEEVRSSAACCTSRRGRVGFSTRFTARDRVAEILGLVLMRHTLIYTEQLRTKTLMSSLSSLILDKAVTRISLARHPIRTLALAATDLLDQCRHAPLLIFFFYRSCGAGNSICPPSSSFSSSSPISCFKELAVSIVVASLHIHGIPLAVCHVVAPLCTRSPTLDPHMEQVRVLCNRAAAVRAELKGS